MISRRPSPTGCQAQTLVRKYSMVWPTLGPARLAAPISGCFLARVMSGRRWRGSSCGSGLNAILLREPVARMISLRKFQHGHFRRIADVHRQIVVAHHQPVDALDQVRHIAEAAGLVALAKDGRAAGSSSAWLTNAGTTRPSFKPHSRPVGVEDAHDAGLDAMLPVVGHRQGLGETLGFVVAAARADRC